LDVEYCAYRFKVHLPRKDLHLFAPVLDGDLAQGATFETRPEQEVQLEAFGGTFPMAKGSLRREWAWLTVGEAERLGTDGLFPPDQRMSITREAGHLCSLLVGIESCAPWKDDLFGGSHGTSGRSKDISAFGKRKWRDFRRSGQEVPADLGGMHVTVDAPGFARLKSVCKELLLSPPSAGYQPGPEQRVEKQLFRDLLQASDEEIGEIFRTRLTLARPSHWDHASTQILGSEIAPVGRSTEEPSDGLHRAMQRLRRGFQPTFAGGSGGAGNAAAQPARLRTNHFQVQTAHSNAATLEAYIERLHKLRSEKVEGGAFSIALGSRGTARAPSTSHGLESTSTSSQPNYADPRGSESPAKSSNTTCQSPAHVDVDAVDPEQQIASTSASAQSFDI
jgi:hypothetical protein